MSHADQKQAFAKHHLKKLVALLALLLLGAQLLSVTHAHDEDSNTELHQSCTICTLLSVHDHVTAIPSSFAISSLDTLVLYTLAVIMGGFCFVTPLKRFSRAPPVPLS